MSQGISTKDEQIKIILKCGRDVSYFINKFCKISHPLKGTIPFKTYPFQDACLRDFLEYRFNIILKSRQLGISTIVAAYTAWLALFHRDQNILFIATKRDVAMGILVKVKKIIKGLPKWLVLAQITSETKQSIEFSHGSSIKAIPTSENAGRSEALSLLVCDEAAHIKDFSTLWGGLYSTLSTGGRAIVLSTPYGVGNMFHKLYSDAESGLNEFNPIKLDWTVHPDRDQAWFEHECRQLGSKRKIASELLCEFVASGDTFLTMDDIDWVKQSISQPIDKWGDDRSVWIWSHPVSDHRYIISADVSRGDSKDCSAFHVIDMDAADIVAEYKGRVPPDRFGELLADVGRKYNTALLCPECNSFGYSTLVKLRELGYQRVYKKNSRAVYIVDYSPIENVETMGFDTNGKTRIQILSKFEEIIRNKLIGIHSSRLYDELKTFVWTGTRAQAMQGSNDDLVMALAIGLWIYDVADGHNKNDVHVHDAILSHMGVSSHAFDYIPSPTQQRMMESTYVNKTMPILIDGDKSIDPRFKNEDFLWVIR